MKLGKIKSLIIFLLFFNFHLNAEDKISTVPLVNLEDLKPSYEEIDSDEKETESRRTYQIKGDFELIEMKNLGIPKRELVKPVWPPADTNHGGWEPSCDI